MITACDIRRSIRQWLVQASKQIPASAIDDATPILEQRIISSVRVIDLLLFLRDTGCARP